MAIPVYYVNELCCEVWHMRCKSGYMTNTSGEYSTGGGCQRSLAPTIALRAVQCEYGIQFHTNFNFYSFVTAMNRQRLRR